MENPLNKANTSKRKPMPFPAALQSESAKTDLANKEGYRMVLSCTHEKTFTGSKARTTSRS
jgi:hypothetical protein